MTFHFPEAHRRPDLEIRIYGQRGDDGNGLALMPSNHPGRLLKCIASNGLGWEHVSVSIAGRPGQWGPLPTWDEMCAVKAEFWGPSDCVVQFHPPEEAYVDEHPVLHLWRPLDVAIPMPHPLMVGFKKKSA